MSDKTVWVVEQGSYSDYRVVGVFDSKQAAEEIAEAINTAEGRFSDDASVAEWPLNPAIAELRRGFRPHLVVMLADGSVERREEQEVSGYELAGRVWVWERTKAPAYIGRGIPDALMVTTWARDVTHAIKIANEHRLRMLASGEFK